MGMRTLRTSPHRIPAAGALFVAAILCCVVAAADVDDDASSTDNDNTASSPSPAPTRNAAASMFNAVDGVTAGGAVLAVLAILVGLALAIAGFKLFRAALFALGFALGGTLLACVAERVFAHESWLRTASWIAFIGGGLLCGALAASVYSAGLFLAGVTAGVLLAAMLHTSLAYQVYPSEPEAVLLVLAAAFGVVGGVLAQQLGKSAVIAATSLVGAALVVWGVGYFAGDYPSAADLERYRTVDDGADGEFAYAIPNVWWVYLCVTLLLALGGALLQYKLTARGVERPGGFAQRSSSAGMYDMYREHFDGAATGASTASSAAMAAGAPRRKVVVIARRRDCVVDTELEPQPPQVQPRAVYSIV